MATMQPIKLGVLGLGRAFTLMIPTLSKDPRIDLVACFDTNAGASAAFSKAFGGVAHTSADALCADPNVEWIYVATPHQLHEEHVRLAAKHGKHALVEKPMALSLSECERMRETCEQAGTQLIVGHSHSFNAPVLRARSIIESGRFGRVRMIQAMNFTDFLYRPRRPEELDTTKGGGVVFSQAAHQIDIVRLLAGGEVASVYARTGGWDRQRPTEGAYTAILNFRSGAFASVTYNGYGFFDTDPWMGGVGEMGWPKNTDTHRLTREKYLSTQDEIAEARRKANRNFGGPDYVPDLRGAPTAFQHFGPVIACCEQADLRLTPYGVEIHDVHGVHLDALPPQAVQRSEVVDEMWSVAREGAAPTHSGAWSMATMEVCLAILESSKKGSAIILEHQAAVPAIRR